ncbi:MAG: hypothetical protein NTW86_11015 [Candidatus Sumerlaeota bacterium]|nr:hypothetical protein [Candidatus Sumerlaeota bacterium]
MSGKIRVLIVDDSTVVRQIFTRALAVAPALEVVGAPSNRRFSESRRDASQSSNAVRKPRGTPFANQLTLPLAAGMDHARAHCDP